MFIRKMLQSDWLDYGTWTIYTFPYRWSGPFIWFSIKVKTQDFWEDDRETINRSHENLVTFGKLSERPEMIDYYILSRIFHQFTFSTNQFSSMF